MNKQISYIVMFSIFHASSMWGEEQSTPLALHPQIEIENETETLIKQYTSIAEKLKSENRLKEALPYLEELHKLQPTNPNIMFDLANAYTITNDHDKALEKYYTLLYYFPTHKIILYNTGYTLKKMNRIKEAYLFYDAAIEQDPEYAEAHFSRSLAFLSEGNFIDGFAEYEWRFLRPDYPKARKYEQPLWDGSDLYGKIIYLYGEQGLGDTFQFFRYAKLVKEKGGRVVVSVQPQLVTVLSLCPYVDKVIALNEQPVHFDVHAPLMSLPYILKTSIDNVPHEIPYLDARPDLVEYWKQKLADDQNFKVGICWQGNCNYQAATLKAVVAAKSISLKKMLPIFSVPGVSFYSLQRETGTDQQNDIPSLHTFDENFDKEHGRFMDTAALIKNLDLIITIDTSISHFAAALGKPVWLMLPEPSDWRWMVYRTDTPWYPDNMILFRQPAIDDWESVVQTIKQELERVVISGIHPLYLKATASPTDGVLARILIIEKDIASIKKHLGL